MRIQQSYTALEAPSRDERTDKMTDVSTFERDSIHILHAKKHWTTNDTTPVMIGALNHELLYEVRLSSFP